MKLSDSGHVIAAHTWDHGNEIYRRRLEYTTSKTEEKLEDITGKPVTYFAYPLAYGIKKLLLK
jgi:peptidoglycan/xylan/chitin deacetylase (PgdA/CDA1 family)